MKRMFFVLICIAGCAAIPAYADADPALIGTYGGWKAYSFADKGGKVCFMAGQPEKQEGKFHKRGDVFFFVTRWNGEKNKNTVSVLNGYTFKLGSPVTLNIADKKFDLFARGDTAWTKDPAADDVVIKDLQGGDAMTVMGTSSRGTETTDTYSLDGVTGAYRAITKECSVKTEKKVQEE